MGKSRGIVVLAVLVLAAVVVAPARQATAQAECDGVPATIEGSGTIVGTSGDDVIVGSDGPDEIRGNGGDDLICGGEGNDTIRGGSGNDRLFGEDDDDVIRGDSGADVIDDEPSSTSCNVITEPELEFFCESDQLLDGGSGADQISGNGIIRGGGGSDTITLFFGDADGGSGNDTIVTAGDFVNGPILRGGSGNDLLDGDNVENQNIVVFLGGPGNDVCESQPQDVLLSC